MIIDISWTEFKTFIDSTNVKWFYISNNDNSVYVFAPHNNVTMRIYLKFNSTEYNEFISTYQPMANAPIDSERPPFASKTLPNGKSLFRRIHGIKLTTDGTSNAQKIIFTVPYTSAKITSTEIINAKFGDAIDFKILDTTTGTVSTIPNYLLNQFGFNVYPSEGRYEQKSEYDADLFVGLQLEITLTPVDTVIRDVYFNLVLHEVT